MIRVTSLLTGSRFDSPESARVSDAASDAALSF